MHSGAGEWKGFMVLANCTFQPASVCKLLFPCDLSLAPKPAVLWLYVTYKSYTFHEFQSTVELHQMPLSDPKELLCSSVTPQKAACCLAVSSARAHSKGWDFIDILMHPGCPPNICSCWHNYLFFMFVFFSLSWVVLTGACQPTQSKSSQHLTRRQTLHPAYCLLTFEAKR